MAVEEFDPEGFFSLQPEELGSERNAITSGVAGIISGVIKIPEGIASVTAELMDLGAGGLINMPSLKGADVSAAAEVEEFFDKINPFEEVAQERAAGKLSEALTQVFGLGAGGFSIANRVATKLLSAKKANKLLDLKRKDLLKGTQKADELNKAAKTKRFIASVAGGAAGETFVTDVEDIGSFGDLFGEDSAFGLTALDRDELQDPSQDAGRKLLNRLKFGGESLFITPFVYGVGKAAKSAASVGKNIEFSNSKLNRFFNKIFSAFRARGAKPQAVFEGKMAVKGAVMADTNKAMELVKRIDKPMNKLFPFYKDFANKSIAKEKVDVLKQINDALFSGDIGREIPQLTVESLTKVLKNKGLKQKDINDLFGTLNEGRSFFTELINASSSAPKDISTLRGLMGDRVKDYLSGSYRIFEEKPILPFLKYKPTDQAYKNARELFARYAAAKGKPFESINQIDDQLDKIIQSALDAKKPTGLPFFKYTAKTAENADSATKKFFRQVLVKDKAGKVLKCKRKTAFRKGDEIIPIGEGSKVFREFFGKIDDPRFSLYNGMTRLSSVARKNELFQNLANQDEIRKRAVKAIEKGGRTVAPGTKGFFFATRDAAEEALPFQEIVKLDDYVSPFFKDDFTVNPLAGRFTSKDIASSLGDSDKILKFLFEARPDATGVEKLATFGYRNLILFPKAASQVAKTILAPVTHFRNLFSATGFSAANGIFFENPVIVARAFKDAFGPLQVGTRSPQANQRYRELLRLGVVNSQTNVNDFRNLLGDVGFGSNLNIEKPLASMGTKLFKAGVGTAKKGMKFAEDLYTAEDDLFKVANFAVERYRLNKAIPNATKEFLDNEAADIVRNTVPNYAYVSDTVRALRRLPLGTFMSFPSEILRTTTNIGQRALKEMRDSKTGKINPFTSDNPLKFIGMKRLLGLTTVLAAAPYGIQKGFQALYDVTNEELQALKRFLPEWSKNSTILPIRDEETGELKYIDFSHGNAYDIAIRPLQTLLNNIEQGIEDEEILLKGLVQGMGEAAGELADPFISEAIYTEALTDLTLRNGVTKDGRRLYSDQTPEGDKLKIQIEHLAESMLPFSYPQLTRLYQAALEKPGERGDFFELPDELLGFAGYRAVRLNPVRDMGYKINGYQKGIRDARALFTGGGLGDSLLKGGPQKPMEVVERYIKSNEAKFNVQKDLIKDLVSADLLGADEDDIRKEFVDRGLKKTYNELTNDIFIPYFPSEKIRKEFEEISERIGEPNPFEEAEDIVDDIREDLQGLSFSDEFDININDYVDEEDFEAAIVTPPLPDSVTSAMPSAQVIQTAQAAVPNTGLTQIEELLLSPDEKLLRQKQRGVVT